MPDTLPQAVRPFAHLIPHDLQLSSGQFVTDCIFCGKPGRFYIDPEKGLWSCKKCGESGNTYSFLAAYHSLLLESTQDADWKELITLRKSIGWKTYRDAELARIPSTSTWMVPVYNREGSIVNLLRWDGPGTKLLGVAGLKQHLYGGELFGDSGPKLGPTDLVVLCEGPWDALITCSVVTKLGKPFDYKLRTVIDETKNGHHKPTATYGNVYCVAVPGADTFKDDWIPYFKSAHVLVAFDNDNAGQRGANKVIERLKPVASAVYRLDWPSNLPDGYDLSDYWHDHRNELSQAAKTLCSLAIPISSPGKKTEPERKRIFKTRPKWSTVMQEYKKALHLDADMIDGLAAMFAVVLSNQISGPPVWLFVVGPPGSGKTTALMTFSDSPKCVYQSSLTAHSLISGFKLNNPEDDPSLIPKLIGNSLILKDFTEVMGMGSIAQEELFSVLRGAYDGTADRMFGNGIHRIYPNCHFSVLAGVTPAIHSFNQAIVGERFLKLTFVRPGRHDPREHILRALSGATEFFHKEQRLKSVAYEFLDTEITRDMVPKFPQHYLTRLSNLAQVIAYLRAGVQREHSGNLSYRPQPEVGTRPAMQLQKLMQGLAIVFGKKVVDEKCYRIAERVAFDTSVGWNLDVAAVMMKVYPKPITLATLAVEANIGRSNLDRRLSNMRELGLVQTVRMKQVGAGQPPLGFSLHPAFVDLWRKAKIRTNVLADKLVQGLGR